MKKHYITRIIPIPSQWHAYQWGARFRCEIGNWNFDGSHFVASAQGDGITESDARLAAQRDFDNPPPHYPEDSLGLGLLNG